MLLAIQTGQDPATSMRFWIADMPPADVTNILQLLKLANAASTVRASTRVVLSSSRPTFERLARRGGER